jgi:regulator of protease activity HflC (stomatin/prohibitin superfamily)
MSTESSNPNTPVRLRETLRWARRQAAGRGAAGQDVPAGPRGGRAGRMLLILAVLGAASGLFLSGCGFEIVDTGHRGVKVVLGEVVGEPLPEGLYFYNPFTSTIREMDVREKKMEGKTTAFTRDVQQVVVSYALNYKPDAAVIHLLFKEVGADWDQKLLPQVVEGNLKNAIGQWDAVHLVENRNKAVRASETAIQEAAATRRILVTRLEVTNLDFHDEFEKATEAKAKAAQDAERAKNETVRIQEEARQKVIAAQAEAESIRIRTKALETSPALIQYEAVQKWDGKLPQYMLGEKSLPFINIK